MEYSKLLNGFCDMRFDFNLIIHLIVLFFLISCAPKTGAFKVYNNEVEVTSAPDPLFGYQWFLGGTTVASSVNINASPVWETGNKGEDVHIAIVDPSSIFLSHADLNDNKDLSRSFNFLNPTSGTDTTITGAESHGTCVAGVIGAKDENGKGIRGIASRASLSARTTSGKNTDIFDALTYKYSETDISSNSYGPPDNVAELNQYYTLDIFDQGISTGLTLGRNGLGTIYIWAAGNGRQIYDRSNYDGYASHYGVMSICSISEQGKISFFSEAGSNLWVCAPGEDLPTTDYLGLNCSNGEDNGNDFSDSAYTRGFTGTSAAAPVVSGVVGLVLREAKLQKKDLGWRDVKMIIAESATKPAAVSWQLSRIKFQDDFGFGIINAQAAVALVKDWIPVGNTEWKSKILGASLLGPTSSGGLDDSAGSYLSMKNFIVDNSRIEDGVSVFNSTISYIEYITLEVKITHSDPGDLELSIQKTPLAGGSAILSKIAKPHDCNNDSGAVACTSATNYLFEFGVTNFLGESAEGTWELKVRDARSNGNSGSIIGWRLKIYGH